MYRSLGWTIGTVLAMIMPCAAAGPPATTPAPAASTRAAPSTVPPARSGGALPSRSDGGTELVSGWKIQSSAVAGEPGTQVSRPDFPTAGWLPISRPETLMAGLLENGRYPNVFYSDNLAKVPTGQFTPDWWYRVRVMLHPRRGGHTFLIMNGVVGAADLWVNGTMIAGRSTLRGPYSRTEYDVTPYVRDGPNAIALQVARNDPKTLLSLSQLDWSPAAPDRNTGLQFAPRLAEDGPASLRDLHVIQKNARDMSTSALTVRADLRNNGTTAVRAELTGTIGRGTARVPFADSVSVPPRSTRTVTLTPDRFPGLRLLHPAIWWPYQLGGQPLYHLRAEVRVNGQVSGRSAEDFGIRTVTSELTPVVPGRTHAPHGYRRFVVNGVPLVIRGGGWSPDMFLRYSPDNVHDQLSYVKNMGLNALRFEGNFPPDDMFAQMDREGLLAMTGWQCCDRWETPIGGWSAELRANAANQAAGVARWLRDHPSVFTFYLGSDEAPDGRKEAIYLAAFAAADWATPLVAAAEYKSSPKLGPSGSKEGTYNYVPPAYWWANGPQTAPAGDPTYTNAGSAWGFDTETSAGNTVPTQDSMNRFLTPADQRIIWDPATATGPTSGRDIFHVYRYNDYTRTARMGTYNTALWQRYGPWSEAATYNRLAQLGGYEVTRAQFEAYLGHSKDPANPSTGVIYWMLNKAWPSLQWNLYNEDFDQPGVYFGAKKAGEPVHVMYDYGDGSVKVVNLTGAAQAGLSARARFIDLNGSVRSSADAAVPTLASQDVRVALSPRVPAGISRTYFLELTLARRGATVSRNVYWLSTKPDIIDWPATLGKGSGAVYRPGGHADLSGLRGLATARVGVSASTRRSGAEAITTVTVRNTGDRPVPAVLLRADVRRGTRDGRALGGDDQVLPITWDDNDVTLWPGQSQTLSARYRVADLRGAAPVVGLTAWNLAGTTVAAP